MEDYLKGWKQYADFSGKSNRKEFWIFILINWVISIVFTQVSGMSDSFVFAGIAGAWSLISLVPSLAIFVRRMHDIGKEWWYMLIPLYNIYLAIQPSLNSYEGNTTTTNM